MFFFSLIYLVVNCSDVKNMNKIVPYEIKYMFSKIRY